MPYSRRVDKTREFSMNILKKRRKCLVLRSCKGITCMLRYHLTLVIKDDLLLLKLLTLCSRPLKNLIHNLENFLNGFLTNNMWIRQSGRINKEEHFVPQ